jgi:hypothetical protein
MEVSAAEQSVWLDQNIPKLVAAMASSDEVRAKVAGPLAAEKAMPFPLTPVAAGLARGDLERWSALAAAAVSANPRYGPGTKTGPRPAVTVMPNTRIVRIETTYPAPAASKDMEPGPLTIDAWVCPDRPTALALLWCRIGGTWFLDTSSPDAVKQSVPDHRHLRGFAFERIERLKHVHPPSETASWDFPRMGSSVGLLKGSKPMPDDRLTCLRGNVVVEASTIEFKRFQGEKDWEAVSIIDQSVPDVIAVMRSIDAGLLRLANQSKPKQPWP